MPVDPTNLRSDIATETPVWPAEVPIATPEFYRDLQVPKTILQDTKLIGQFFKTQGARLYSLEHTEKLKTDSSEIHDFETIAAELESFTPLAPEDDQLLSHLHQEVSVQLRLGTQSADVRDLIDRAGEYVRAHPTTSDTASGDGDSLDIFDQIFVNEISQGREERDRKYQELLAAAKDPETVMLLIAYRYTDFYGAKFGRVMEAYKTKIDELDRIGAKMALANAPTGDIAKANAELAKNTSYLGMATFAIQSIKSKIDQVQNSAHSVLGSLNEQYRQIISNVRG